MDNKKYNASIAEARADLFGRAHPETFVYYLNADPAEDAATVVPLGKQAAEQLGEGENVRFPGVATARKQQRALRRAVDRYLETRDWDQAAEDVNPQLAKRPYQLYLRPEHQFLPLPPKKQREAALGLIRSQRPLPIYWDDWEGFARLLASNELKRLKKCPECGTYFLAIKPKQQKYCTRDCGQRVADRKYEERHPEKYHARKAAARKLSRQRKKQQAI